MTLSEMMHTVPMEDIGDDAEKVQFGRALATAITAVFVAIGWIIGATWYGIRYCAVAVRYGYRQGARMPRQTQQTQT